MNYILHGEDTSISRQKLNEIISFSNPDGVYRQSPVLNPILDNQLFAEPELKIIEFLKKDELKEFPAENFFKRVEELRPETAIILWFNFELSPVNKILAQAQRSGFKEFKFNISPVVFKIVDAFFAPKKLRGKFYSLLADFGLKSSDQLLLLQMITRGARLFLWASMDNHSFLSLKGFVRRQAEAGKLMRAEKLIDLYSRLIDLERRFKVGSLDLTSELLILYEEV